MVAPDASRDEVQGIIGLRTLSRHNSISRIAMVCQTKISPGEKAASDKSDSQQIP